MKTKISKKIITSILALLLIPMLVITLLAGCAKQTYTVTVINGTGGGEYEAGETCTVTATVTDGQQFVRWLVNGEEVSTSPSYTFTVTENMTITAVFHNESVVYLSKSVGGNPIGGFGIGDDTYDRDWSAGDENTPWEKGDEAYADVLRAIPPSWLWKKTAWRRHTCMWDTT